MTDVATTPEPDYATLLASAPRPMTAEWLRSPAYDALMQRHAPSQLDLSEASKQTRSYVWRHSTCAPVLSTWKWRGMQLYRDRILAHLEGKLALDFGGACGPVGCGSIVVDVRPSDVFGRPTALLACIPDGCADTVFTSHTLEHVDALDETLAELRRVLRVGGTLIALVPSWKREIWRVGNLKSEIWGDHVWDFGLEPGPSGVSLVRYANVADAIAARLTVTHAAYCGDDNIVVFARRDDA